MHFDLNQTLKQSDCENDESKIVDVDPQFCPSKLAFILWVSHSLIVLI